MTQVVHHISDDTLIDYYRKSSLSAKEIAGGLGVDVKTILRRWKKLREEGRITGQRWRNNSHKSERERNRLHIEKVEDGRNFTDEGGSERLLAKLREVHGEPRYDIPPGVK